MNGPGDGLVLVGSILLFAAVLAAVCSYRERMAEALDAAPALAEEHRPEAPDHNARACLMCAPLRHPANHATRVALAALPRQTRGESL
jgi:hypothetical protein